MIDSIDDIPERWRPQLVRAGADKLATGLAAVMLDRPVLRQQLAATLKATSADLPAWISTKDVLEAFDRLVKRMKRRGGVKPKKEATR